MRAYLHAVIDKLGERVLGITLEDVIVDGIVSGKILKTYILIDR